jgi:hypothetical protein
MLRIDLIIKIRNFGIFFVFHQAILWDIIVIYYFECNWSAFMVLVDRLILQDILPIYFILLHLNDYIISLRREIWAHKTNLTPLIIKIKNFRIWFVFHQTVLLGIINYDYLFGIFKLSYLLGNTVWNRHKMKIQCQSNSAIHMIFVAYTRQYIISNQNIPFNSYIGIMLANVENWFDYQN